MPEQLVENLFGEMEVPKAHRQGRPAHRWNEKTANKIKLLLALGWTNERIAAACHISQPTLRKCYFSVLKQRDVARDVVEARRIELLWRAAEKGNVGAIKSFGDLMDVNAALEALKARMAEKDKSSVNPPKGKKEQRIEDASQVGGLYEAPRGPTLQ